MSAVTVYVLDADGRLDCHRTGDIDSVMMAIDIEQKDFTMSAPPDDVPHWRWINNQWIADDTAE